MTTAATAKAIHDQAEKAAHHLFAPTARASDEATIATAEGLLDGISEVLLQRLGAVRAAQIVSRAGDILDRVVLDGERPRRPNYPCWQL